MNRLRTIGVLGVILLLPTHAVAQTPRSPWALTVSTDKMTDKKVLTASIRAANGEHPSLKYELALKCDGSSVNVALTTFNGTQPRPIPWSVNRWTSGGQSHASATPGAPPRVDPIVGHESIDKSFRYRIDSGEVHSTTLAQTHTNGGEARLAFAVPTKVIQRSAKIGTLIGQSQEEVRNFLLNVTVGNNDYIRDALNPTITAEYTDSKILENAQTTANNLRQTYVAPSFAPGTSRWAFYNMHDKTGKWVYELVLTWLNGTLVSVSEDFEFALRNTEVVMPQLLPEMRLVIADLFPGETVEFPFNNLTADQRAAMQTMCFPPAAPTAAPAEPKVPSGAM